MRSRLHQEHSANEAETNRASAGPSKRRRGRKVLVALVLLAIVLGIGRAMLPWAVRDYVNRTLERNLFYSGTIGGVQIHLWRGAYSIESVKLNKITGNIPAPFFSAPEVDLAIQWKALLHGRVVGHVLMEGPEINFVDSPNPDESQTGSGGPWLQMIQDLFPFSINSFKVQDGSVHFRTYQSAKPVDVYLSHLDLTIDNLSNITDDSAPLPATVQATATAMDEAKLNFKMSLDPFSYRPTFHLALRLLNLDVTKINDLALAYGKFDFKRGWFDLVLETDCKEGQITGYVKPLFRDLKLFSLAQDIKQDNVLEFFWQALLGTTTSLLKNHPRDQFGTLIPFTGEASGPASVAIFTTIGNIFRNAFIRAYLPRLEQTPSGDEEIHFQAPDFKDAISTSNGDP
jgi:hypothetical protein